MPFKPGPFSLHLSSQALPNNQVALVIADDGIGMDASALLQAFEVFFTTKLGRGCSSAKALPLGFWVVV